MQNFKKIHTDQAGFTLVELAIVLMIIGLLIGGILRGQEMMNNARLQATIKQVMSYTAAVNTFRDGYGAMPGDLRNAESRLANCTLAGNNCRSGNGDGIVGTPDYMWLGSQEDINSENTQFWKHLALTHMISGIDPSATLPIWGKSHPASAAPGAGGFTVLTSASAPDGETGNTNASVMTGALVLRLHGSLSSQYIEYEPSVSPKQGAYIDRKMDDGMPQTGDVQSRAAGNGAYASACESASGYDETREDAFCVMSFLLSK